MDLRVRLYLLSLVIYDGNDSNIWKCTPFGFQPSFSSFIAVFMVVLELWIIKKPCFQLSLEVKYLRWQSFDDIYSCNCIGIASVSLLATRYLLLLSVLNQSATYFVIQLLLFKSLGYRSKIKKSVTFFVPLKIK